MLSVGKQVRTPNARRPVSITPPSWNGGLRSSRLKDDGGDGVNLPDRFGKDVACPMLPGAMIDVEEDRARDGQGNGRVEPHVTVPRKAEALLKKRLELIPGRFQNGLVRRIGRIGQAGDLRRDESRLRGVGPVSKQMKVVVGLLLGGIEVRMHGHVQFLGNPRRVGRKFRP